MSLTQVTTDIIPPYVYKSLATDFIRLLSLNPHGSSIISGSLKEFALKEAPPYFTLSYCWGPQDQLVPIQIDGQLLHVGPSLVMAIARLRELATENPKSDISLEWVWIDKICINQDNASERSQQVQLMGSIYFKAIRTLIWLGPELCSCSEAWALIDQMYDIFKRDNPNAEFLADIPLQLYSNQSHAAFRLPEWQHDLWRHLRKLFELPWFTRAWIIQEVALSTEDPVILHGQHRYPWHRLGWVSAWMRRNGYLRLAQIPHEIQNVDTIASIRRSRVSWRLDALLIATSIKFHATDPRDKVYALLGLAAESRDPAKMPDAFRPDYELDVSEIYTRIASFLLRGPKGLAVLTRTGGVAGSIIRTRRAHNIRPFPSWVPDWTDFLVARRDVARSLSWLTVSSTTGEETLGFPQHYNAAAGLSATFFPSPDPSVLRLSGLKVDSVVKAIQFNAQGRRPEQSLLLFWKAALPLLVQGKALDWIDSFIKVTTAEQFSLSGSVAEQIMKDGSAYLLERLLSNSNQNLCPAPGDISAEVMALLRARSSGATPERYAGLAANFCLNRAFVVTSKGRMGIAPLNTQSKDLVTVIFGGGVPYVLRLQGNLLFFVGESYIHGLMDGEAIQDWANGELTEEILELR